MATTVSDAPAPTAVGGAMGDIRVVSELLGVSTKTAARLPIPGRVKLGRLVRFDLERVRQWIRAGCPVS